MVEEILNKMQSARRGTDNARRYLDSGEAINWVCDELRSALMWSMEAWLIHHGHKPDYGNGWVSMQAQFLETAPKELRSQAAHCLAEVTFLQYALEGGLGFMEPIPAFEEWKKKAYTCLSNTEDVIVQIEKEVNSQ